MRYLRNLLRRFPRIRQRIHQFRGFFLGHVSGALHPIAHADVSSLHERVGMAWLDPAIPGRQNALVEDELNRLRTGENIPQFVGLAGLLQRLIGGKTTRYTLLEIGCASGYYLDTFDHRGVNVAYTGCDISPTFVQMARVRHPEAEFLVADALDLPFAAYQFDIALSGCCLLHIPNYAQAIAETARVAKSYAVFHRTPVHHLSSTQFFSKKAYGVETLELSFNEQELVQLFASSNLAVVDVLTIDTGWRDGDATAVKTYLCRKLS